jgi:hypothetical protein
LRTGFFLATDSRLIVGNEERPLAFTVPYDTINAVCCVNDAWTLSLANGSQMIIRAKAHGRSGAGPVATLGGRSDAGDLARLQRDKGVYSRDFQAALSGFFSEIVDHNRASPGHDNQAATASTIATTASTAATSPTGATSGPAATPLAVGNEYHIHGSDQTTIISSVDRPGCVTLLVILTFLGIVGSALGVIVLVPRLSVMPAWFYPATVVLLVLYSLYGWGLWQMKQWARWVTIGLNVLSLLGAVLSLLATEAKGQAIASMIVPGIIVYWFAVNGHRFH